MGTRNTVISSLIAKGTSGNQSKILSALVDENEEAKKSDLKKKKK